MAILDSELQMFLSNVITDDATNGGTISKNVVTSGQPGNVWPPVFKAEREIGSEKYRKTFLKISDDDDGILYAPMIWIDNITLGDDWVILYAGSQTDVAGTDGAGITGTDAFGCAMLQANAVVSAGSIVVTVEDATLATGAADSIFRDGDTIRITNKDDPASGTGTEEIHVISGTPTVSGNDVTITLVGSLANAYNTDDNTYGTRVMSVYEPGNIEGAYSGFVDTTAGDGIYDDGSYPPVADNIGTIEQEITITMTSATTFTAVSDVAGVTLTGGTIVAGQTWQPSNPDFGKPYFVFEYDGFSLTWATDDTIVFTMHPVAAPFWQKRVVPVLADSTTGNKAIFAFTGESV